jgi:hypothetical protein
MSRKLQTILLAVVMFIVVSATTAYVTANFEIFWSRDDAVGSQHIDQFKDIRDRQRDQFQLEPQSSTP